MVWGVSLSDATNCGWNTAVGFVVLGACAGTAYIVRQTAAKVLDANTTMKEADKIAYWQYAQYASLALGLGVAGAAYIFIPDSYRYIPNDPRFALINDDSTYKMLKLGTVQTLAGFVIDRFVSQNFYSAAVIGFGGAFATRFGNLALAGLGIVGAGLGSGYIQR